MALIDCSECGKQISDKASACPGCGAPVQGPSHAGPKRVKTSEDSLLTRNRGCGDIIIFLPIIIIIIILIAVVAS